MTISKAAERKQLLDRMDVLEQRLEQQENFGELIGNTARHARGLPTRARRRADLGHGAHPRRERHRQGAHRARHPPALRRADRPFFAVNCSAIPDDLVESELFGHVRGAFTGAVSARVGLFEAADKGTVFLDEIGDLPLAGAGQAAARPARRRDQARRLQRDRSRVDVRVIAATNVDLEEQDRGGQVPRRSLLPPARHRHSRAAAARASRRHPAARLPLPAQVRATA